MPRNFVLLLATLLVFGAAASPAENPDGSGLDSTGDDTGVSFLQWPFTQGFVASFLLIICAELGDKTFFIAAILSMKHNHGVVFAAFGVILPAVLSKTVTHYCCIGLFLFFGLRLLNDARNMDDSEENEEMKEVEMELKKKDEDAGAEGCIDDADVEGGSPCNRATKPISDAMTRRVFAQAFMMTFLAEWGDRSQISTIALAAAKSPAGVTVGGIIGHSICTGIAVVGGKMLASRISERQVSIAGGLLFLVFAASAVYSGVED